MKQFFKDYWPPFVYIGWIVLVIFFGVNSSQHTWAYVGMVIFLGAIPIAFAVGAILAYGEWIFDMLTLWQTDKNEFSNRILMGLGKTFAVLAVLSAFFWVGMGVTT
jgi:hypothetical protein